ncbi:MAG: DUF192 domain-containing protein [Rhodocyclaceae bacterium]|nr:DUF192 domain-containing protein [Rhodocyclaceae bacterium]MDZ4213639.1 DUF192 domain-containing protein [Rhodocyclaceae bacterium]
MHRLFLFLSFFASLAVAQGMPVMELTAGFHRIEAEVAATPQSRAQGLMHRKAMDSQRGMLFVFTHDAAHCMWMKNTLLPLAVAFMDANGRILNIAEMKPHSEENHCAMKPARYALEMNAGWFAQRGLKAGDVMGGIERAPRGQ